MNDQPKQPTTPEATPAQPVEITATPAEQQRTAGQQYFSQPQAAPVQYVVMAESLKGVKGWLLFFATCFALSGVTYISIFFTAMSSLDTTGAILNLIFAPILAAASITTTVFIAMQKQLGKWLAIGTLSLFALYSVVSSIVLFALGNGSTIPVLISSIIINLVLEGLFILYFFVSKRVKETLVG